MYKKEIKDKENENEQIEFKYKLFNIHIVDAPQYYKKRSK
jgi:hypothetical protein